MRLPTPVTKKILILTKLFTQHPHSFDIKGLQTNNYKMTLTITRRHLRGGGWLKCRALSAGVIFEFATTPNGYRNGNRNRNRYRKGRLQIQICRRHLRCGT